MSCIHCCTSCQYYFAAMLQCFVLENKRYCWTNEIQDRPEENIFSSISNSHITKKTMIPGSVSVSLGRPDIDLWFFFSRRVLPVPLLLLFLLLFCCCFTVFADAFASLFSFLLLCCSAAAFASLLRFLVRSLICFCFCFLAAAFASVSGALLLLLLLCYCFFRVRCCFCCFRCRAALLRCCFAALLRCCCFCCCF